ncbi:MAG TPA: isoprenylcysteine carboxylmethyltransferase family protein [Kofleriaceae bacterium]|nr:isoprenylcysteine carboxylmethyltransferase family protein [Kofleriaceae bacterium]
MVVFPPVLPASGFLLGVLLGKLYPLAPPGPVWLRLVGAAIACAGAAGFAWMVITMKRARTPIHNRKTPTTLVETGPFRRTRNPMYLFGTVFYAGMTLVAWQLWSLALLPIVTLAMHYGVVLREEAYLDRKFGNAYRQFKQRVPRWL